MYVNDKLVIRMVGDRKMKCSDIPDEVFALAVLATTASDGTRSPDSWRMRWDVKDVLETVLGPIPEKLFVAKAAKLMASKKLMGCPCGCRGDYHLECDKDPHCYETCD